MISANNSNLNKGLQSAFTDGNQMSVVDRGEMLFRIEMVEFASPVQNLIVINNGKAEKEEFENSLNISKQKNFKNGNAIELAAKRSGANVVKGLREGEEIWISSYNGAAKFCRELRKLFKLPEKVIDNWAVPMDEDPEDVKIFIITKIGRYTEDGKAHLL